MKPLRWSDLKWMGQSPAHFRYYSDNPPEPTTAMNFGTLVHGLALVPECFEPIVFQGERRGKAWAEFKAANDGKVIYTQDEVDRAEEIVSKLVMGPHWEYLEAGFREQRVTWNIAGVDCAGTPDVVTYERIVDLKVTDMDPRRMRWHAMKMGWLAQLCWYRDGMAKVGRLERRELYIVTVSPKPPYLSCVYQLCPSAVEYGTRQWRSYFEQYQVCAASNTWPGYSEAVLPLDVPEDELTLTLDGEEIEL